jgi:hypothetical protein
MRLSWRTPPLVVILAALLTAAPAAAAPGDVGTEDFSYAPATGSPTESKPESKLWFADGSWWGDLFSPSAGAHRIHRLDPATDRWVDTGTTTDTRRNANSDVLWHAASRKLYVVSHVFSEVGASTPPAQSGALYRYSYDPGTKQYTLDQGYPVVINGAKSQSLVIDMDSTGRLWAAWQQDGSIWVNHTDGNDAHWGTPYTAWASPWLLKSDDVAGLVPFGGDKVGILFSYEFFPKGWYYLIVHRDGAGDGAANWAPERLPDIDNANNHVNLKADRAGRLFVAVKRHANDPAAPRIQLLRRDTAGTWSYATFGSTGDGHTRPIVVLEDPGSRADVFATCPRVPGHDAGSGGRHLREDVVHGRDGLRARQRDAGPPGRRQPRAQRRHLDQAARQRGDGRAAAGQQPDGGHRRVLAPSAAPHRVPAARRRGVVRGDARRPGRADGPLHRHVERRAHQLALGLRRRHDVQRAPRHAPLRAGGDLHGHPDGGECHQHEHAVGRADRPRARGAGGAGPARGQLAAGEWRGPRRRSAGPSGLPTGAVAAQQLAVRRPRCGSRAP